MHGKQKYKYMSQMSMNNIQNRLLANSQIKAYG